MERILVLSADKWQMPDEKTGEMLTGLSVWYINDYRDDSPEAVGMKPTKVSLQKEAATATFAALSVIALPALCDAAFASRPGAAGKATLTISSIKPVTAVDVFSVTPEKPDKVK